MAELIEFSLTGSVFKWKAKLHGLGEYGFELSPDNEVLEVGHD